MADQLHSSLITPSLFRHDSEIEFLRHELASYKRKYEAERLKSNGALEDSKYKDLLMQYENDISLLKSQIESEKQKNHATYEENEELKLRLSKTLDKNSAYMQELLETDEKLRELEEDTNNSRNSFHADQRN